MKKPNALSEDLLELADSRPVISHNRRGKRIDETFSAPW